MTEVFYGFVYITTNLLNGKRYIGKRVLKGNKKDNTYLGSGTILKQSIKKNGIENFNREILCYCIDEETLKKTEIKLIKSHNTIIPFGYNISEVNAGGDVMKNHPDKEEINKKRIERVKAFNRDEEWRKKIGDSSRGKSISEEHRLKIIASKKENPYTHNEERLKKMSDSHKGKRLSEETKLKLSIINKGIPKSKEQIEKVRKALLGKKRPQSVIDKMSKSMIAKYKNGWQSPHQIEIFQYDKNSGLFIQSFKSATDAGRLLNIDRKGITNNCTGKSKSSAHFIWSKIKTKNIYDKE